MPAKPDTLDMLRNMIKAYFLQVVLPILRTLYNAPTSNNHHIYMSLIVLLILSEDDLFNTSVHDVNMTKQVNIVHVRTNLKEMHPGRLSDIDNMYPNTQIGDKDNSDPNIGSVSYVLVL